MSRDAVFMSRSGILGVLEFPKSELFPDHEEKIKPEFPSSIPTPLDFLLARKDVPVAKTEIGDEFCVLPSSFYKDGHGTYFISFPVSSITVREDIRAYVSPELPKPHLLDDCYEILPKFLPIRIMDKCFKFESHGKRGRKPFTWKNERVIIRKFLLLA